MVSRKEVEKTLSEYDEGDVTLGIMCSHSALQLIHGAKLEGFGTIGICLEERRRVYDSFPGARADEFLVVEEFDDILEEGNQRKLLEESTVVIPHGSFVEYVGAENLLKKFRVPIFGNRESLKWEGERKRQRKWLKNAGVDVAGRYGDPSEIDGRVFVKFGGAKGGRGFFIADSEGDFWNKLENRVEEGAISKRDSEDVTIQEFLPGIRYYPHYFHSLLGEGGISTERGWVEILGMDRRIEPIDESYRGLPDVPREFFDYTVTGNEPLVVREKLLVDLMEMGTDIVKTSEKLFPPGIIGPFCLETVYHPDRGFTVFEISGRIVAGTNLFPTGSPYSPYFYQEPMSTGRRIAREIKMGIDKGQLAKIVY